jgi:hypothetical protein
MAAAVTLPDQVSRITGSAFGGSIKAGVHWATMTECTHAPTLSYRIENVALDNGVLYRGLLAEYVSRLGWPRLKGVDKVAGQMLLASSESGTGFFGDWICEEGPLEILSDTLGITPLKVKPHTRFPHAPELGPLLGLRPGFSDLIRVKNLFVIDDMGFNRNKRQRLQCLRSRLRLNLKYVARAAELVYLLRGEGHQSVRRLTNEREIVDQLLRMGFHVLDPTKMSATELLGSMLDCRVVVGVEGSQLAYGFLGLKEGGLMVSLQPPYRFHVSWRTRCVSVGVKWGFLVGIEVPGGFAIPPAELLELLGPFV